MLILGIDTAGKQGGIALYRHSPRLLDSSPIPGGTFSAQLVPQISALLAKHGFTAQDLQGVVAVSGPGSFTGLRVGLAAVKALAEALRIPIATVSVLEMIIAGHSHGGRSLAALDAGREEAYVGDYEFDERRQEDGMRCREETLLTWQRLAARAKELNVPVITPDAPLSEALAAKSIAVFNLPRPEAEQAIRLGYPKLMRGDTVSVDALDANYLRQSDAELFSKPKL